MITRRRFVELCSAAAATASARLGASEARFRIRGIGISNYTVGTGNWNSDPIGTAFPEAAKLGYHYMEVFKATIQPYWDKPQELKDKMQQMGLRGFSCISSGPPMRMQFADAAVASQLIADHMELALWGKKWFGIDHLKTNTDRRRPEGTTAEDLTVMAKTMNELGKRLADEGMTFAPHPHLWTQLQTRTDIARLMDLTNPKYVFLTLDTGHATMAGMDPVELTKAYWSRFAEVHFKDTKPEDRGGHKGATPEQAHYRDKGNRIFYELGTGGVDFPAIMAVLKKNNWDGWLDVELDSTDTTCQESAAVSKKYMEGVLHLTL